MNYFKYLIKSFRIKEVFLIIGFIIIGIFFALNIINFNVLKNIFLFYIAVFFYSISIYNFNIFCGYTYDIKNNRFKFLRFIDKKIIFFFVILFLILSFFMLYFINRKIIFIGIIGFLFCGIYSFPKIGLKHFPIISTVITFISEIIHFHMGFILLSRISLYSFLISIYFALLISGGHINHELIDYEADKKAGFNTNAVFLKQRGALFSSNLIFIMSGIYLIVLFVFQIIKFYEFITFFSSFLLQIITIIYFFYKTKEVTKISSHFRFLYRIYYIGGGIAYIFFKCLNIISIK